MFGLGVSADLYRTLLSEPAREEYIDAEYDTTERNATVVMYSRIVRGLASSNSSSGGTGSAHHWALVVHFEDGSDRLLEGNEKDNHLHGYYRKHMDDGMTKLKELGSVFISPFRLRNIARDNALNGSFYYLLNNNCQDWAIRAAKDISREIGKNAANIQRMFP